jgi:hypothetical protein
VGREVTPVSAVVLVVLGGDAGGGLLAEPDVDAERGEVPVAGLGLELGGAAALGSEVGQSAVAQLVQGVPGAVRVVKLGRLFEQVLGARVGQSAAAGVRADVAQGRRSRPVAAARRSARNTGPVVRPASSRGRVSV